MTELAIFSFETPTKMSPEAFAALSDADKSLFSRLVQERRASKATVRQATGLPFTRIAQLGAQLHAVRLGVEERSAAVRNNPASGNIPMEFARLLQIFARCDGPLTISYADMEAQADLIKGSAHPCLSGLKNRGLLVCLRSGRGGRTATWSITDDGRALAASLFSEVSYA
ncbi:hypothetical protein FB480_101878 [Agrobacterium vitis]|nr:hypothetical protein FB480_101878 [Agrobacterium vitis]